MSTSIQQQLLACPREVRQYVLKQATEIERLTALNDDKHKHLESYRKMATEDKNQIERLKECNEQISLTHAEIINKQRAEIERLTAIITDRNCAIHELQDTMEWQRDKLTECRRLLREACDSIDMSLQKAENRTWFLTQVPAFLNIDWHKAAIVAAKAGGE